VGGVILISFLLGLTFYNLGLASSLDKKFIQKLPPRFHQMIDSRLEVWQEPQRGFLIGEIQNFSGNSLELRDFKGRFWQIALELEAEELNFIEPLLRTNEKIRLMGSPNPEKCEQCFSAIMVRPLNLPKGDMIHEQFREVFPQDLQGKIIKRESIIKIQE